MDIKSISICLATHNGEPFIERQLRSILPQLNPHDEIIIVDDASTDQTRSVIAGIGDQRITVITQTVNQGSTASFATAIATARGSVIFLCDQDDVWMPHKIAKTLETIHTSGADLVVHDAQVMFQEKILIPSLFGIRRFKVRSRLPYPTLWINWVNSTFTGCCMAFTKEMIPFILPIPNGVWHDQWIGMMIAKHGFKICYLPDILVYMHRHDYNLTEISPRYNRWWLMLYERGVLVWHLINMKHDAKTKVNNQTKYQKQAS